MTTSAYPFDWGFSDAAIQIQPTHYTDNVMSQIAKLQPKYWRIEVPWNNVSTALQPGPFKSAGNKASISAVATGTGHVGDPHLNGQLTVQAVAQGAGVVTGTAPGASGRDWSYVDVAINDIRLKTGADIILMIGGGMPSGWTTDVFQEFCAEVAQRYGPGGPGIRTDGKYAGLTGWGVTHFEIWNEPNNQVLWAGGNVDPVKYTGLLKAGYTGIKSVMPGAASTVIFAGMQHTQFVGQWFGYGWITEDEVSFLRQCYAAGAHGYFDKMATHIYPADDTAVSGNTISGMNLPAVQTDGDLVVSALATGSGAVNATPSNTGAAIVTAAATGSGRVNAFQPAGPAPSINMDNFRQLQGIWALMVANGDGDKKISITEMGYTYLDTANGMTAQLVADYTEAVWDILARLPYIDLVLVYNVLDISNATKNDAINGYGVLDVTETPRPLYNWLATVKPAIPGAGALAVQAVATGSGAIGANGSLAVTAVAQGSGRVSVGGGIITATITGSGRAGLGDSAAVVVTAAATGTGVVGLSGGGGSAPGAPPGGSLTVQAAASGVGKVNVQPHSNGDLLVRAAAFGSGSVGQTTAVSVPITAIATGTGVVDAHGAEIGVVGTDTGGALVVTAAAQGTGHLV